MSDENHCPYCGAEYDGLTVQNKFCCDKLHIDILENRLKETATVMRRIIFNGDRLITAIRYFYGSDTNVDGSEAGVKFVEVRNDMRGLSNAIMAGRAVLDGVEYGEGWRVVPPGSEL